MLEDGAAALIRDRELLEMIAQVGADLLLGRRDESQAPAVADRAGERAEAKRHPVEQRVQHAGMTVEFVYPLLAPGKMIDLLGRGLLHAVAHGIELGGQRLALVERLCAHLAGVVDAHQPRDMAPLFGIERRGVEFGSRVGAPGHRRLAGGGAARAIESDHEMVNERKLAVHLDGAGCSSLSGF